MPGQKISSMTPVSNLLATDEFPLARSGSTYKITGDKFASKVQLDALSSSVIGNFVLKSSLAAVATSGSYNDLSNKPTGTINGILKSNGSGVMSAAIPGTDYVAPSAIVGLSSYADSRFIPKPASASAQQVLTYNGSTATWVASAIPVTGGSSSLPSGTAYQVLTYNGSTATWVASAAPQGGASTPVKTVGTFNGSINYLTINGYTNTNAVNYSVYLDGVKQVPDTDYSVSSTGGGRITFTTTPPNGVVADVTAWQLAPGATPTGGGVTGFTSTQLTGTGSQANFAINGYTGNTAEKYLVFVGGLFQHPTVNYTIQSPSNIVFSVAPPNDAPISVMALAF